MVDVHSAEFRAALQRGNCLAGIEQPVRVESGLEGVKLRQFIAAELCAHLVDLLHAHAVFPGDGAAHLDAEVEYPPGEGLGPLEFSGPVGVVEDERVKVAVAGMEYIGHPEVVFLRPHLHPPQHLGQALSGYGAVDAVVIRRDAPHGGKRHLPALPEQQALGFVPGHPDFGGAVPSHHRFHASDLGRGVCLGSVHLAKQDRFGIHRVPAMGKVLGGPDGEIVHHLQPRGDDPVRNDSADSRPGGLHVTEGSQHETGMARHRQQLDRHLQDDAEQSLRPRHHRQEIVARGVGRIGSDGQQFTVHGRHLEAQDVMDSQAVFQAMHATGILRHVAADGAGDLRAWIRSIVQAVRFRGL